MLNKVFTQNKWFFIPYLVLLACVLPVLILTHKADLHLWLNSFYNGFFDEFFRLITWFGDGVFICSVGFVLLFFSFRNPFYVISTYLATGILVQVLKRFIFPGVLRPVKYFQDIADLHLVEGVTLLTSRSFPSGHATSAFALFLCLAMIIRNKSLKFACLILAILVSYSRVYLSQHFLIDIYFGSLIGSLGAICLYLAFFSSDKNWHKASIISLFTHK